MFNYSDIASNKAGDSSARGCAVSLSRERGNLRAAANRKADCGASGRVELPDAARTDTGEASSKTSGCTDGLWAHTRGLRQTSPNSKRYTDNAVMEKK